MDNSKCSMLNDDRNKKRRTVASPPFGIFCAELFLVSHLDVVERVEGMLQRSRTGVAPVSNMRNSRLCGI
jgi:hypothetical protein